MFNAPESPDPNKNCTVCEPAPNTTGTSVVRHELQPPDVTNDTPPVRTPSTTNERTDDTSHADECRTRNRYVPPTGATTANRTNPPTDIQYPSDPRPVPPNPVSNTKLFTASSASNTTDVGEPDSAAVGAAPT